MRVFADGAHATLKRRRPGSCREPGDRAIEHRAELARPVAGSKPDRADGPPRGIDLARVEPGDDARPTAGAVDDERPPPSRREERVVGSQREGIDRPGGKVCGCRHGPSTERLGIERQLAVADAGVSHRRLRAPARSRCAR
jgi:hypothetical protein